jgi:hypothetical protein
MIMKTCTTLAFLLLFSVFTFSQNVQINPTGITPAPSGGAAMPRISYDAIQALPSPQQGDMAYDNTFKCLRYFNGSKWIKLLNSQDTPEPSQIIFTYGGVPNSITNNSATEVFDIKTDLAGNVYIFGRFSNNSTLTLGTIVLTPGVNFYSFFVAKYSPDGTIQWAQKSSSPNTTVLNKNKLELDEISGDVYLSSTYSGGFSIGVTNYPSSSPLNLVVLIKYNINGVFQWVKQIQCTNGIYIYGTFLDDNGSIYITGSFYGTASIGLANIISSGGEDIFIAKFSSNGILQSFVKGGGTGNENPSGGIIVDSNGGIYIAGFYTGSSSMFGTNVLNVSSTYQMFLAKYDPVTSNWSWARSPNAGSTNATIAIGLAFDINNNIIVAGSFTNTSSLLGATLTSEGLNDIFISKVNSNGGNISIYRYGDYKNNNLLSMYIDSQNNIYLSTVEGFNNYKIVKLDGFGNEKWVEKIGGNGQSIVKSSTGIIYVCGSFCGTQSFGLSTITCLSSPFYAPGDFFVTKFVE